MKPIFLMYFILIIVTTMIFAIVYISFQDLVENNPETFLIAMIAVLSAGMYGMIDNIISSTTHDKKEYE